MELNEILANASKLMSPEGQRKINNASKNVSRKDIIGENYDNDDYGYPMQSTNVLEQPMYTQPMYTQPITSQNSKLPKAILESMRKNPINDVVNEYNTEGSVLDSLNISTHNKIKKQINEQTQQPVQNLTQQPIQQTVNTGIDYNYLKFIVNECIKENLKQIKDELLNESSLKLIRLGGENKIQLIDNKNNLYESKLEYKKNISKK